MKLQPLFQLCQISFDFQMSLLENIRVELHSSRVGQVVTHLIEISFDFGCTFLQVFDVEFEILYLLLKFNDVPVCLLELFSLLDESHVHVFWEHGKVLHFFFFLLKHFALILLKILQLLIHSARLHLSYRLPVFNFLSMSFHLEKDTSLHVFILVCEDGDFVLDTVTQLLDIIKFFELISKPDQLFVLTFVFFT